MAHASPSHDEGLRSGPEPARDARQAAPGAAAVGPVVPGLGGFGLPALQAIAGNAAVAGLVSRPTAGRAALARQPAPAAPPAAKHSLTTADKSRLDVSKGLIDKAKANKDKALDALTQYSTQAPVHLRALKTNADKNLERYKAVSNHVNYIISEAKEIAKIQDEVLSTIVGAALGGVGTLLGAVSEEAKEYYERLEKSWSEAKEEFKLGEIGGSVKTALGGAPESSGPSIAEPWAQELEFYKSFAALQANSTGLLGVGVSIGKLGEPIGKVEDAIAGVRDSGVTRSDYPLDKIEHDAATLESSSRGLASAGPGITKLLGELKSAVDQAKASAPKDDKEAEKQLWKSWAAGLGGTDYKTLDLDVIENYLKKIGIWKELGIDIGDWFSSEEQILAVGSARAQEMVISSKESIVFERSGTFVPTIQLSGLPGSPKLTARLDASSTVFSSKVRAVVIDAETIGAEGAIDTDLLKQVSKNSDGSYNKDRIAEYLLRNGYVRAVLRAYEDLSQEEGQGSADGGGAPEAPPP